jgi:hypothetical protein
MAPGLLSIFSFARMLRLPLPSSTARTNRPIEAVSLNDLSSSLGSWRRVDISLRAFSE